MVGTARFSDAPRLRILRAGQAGIRIAIANPYALPSLWVDGALIPHNSRILV